MSEIHLTGTLVCTTAEDASTVTHELPAHLALTRAEPGCLSFEVTPAADPLTWNVDERFASEDAFHAHQKRTANSEWYRRTTAVERRYQIEGLSEASPTAS